MRARTRKDYKSAYSDIKKFNKKVDQLGADERKIHADVQKLEEECAGDTQKFQKKFGPLRVKVFDNLRTGEKMIFQDKRLKTDFTKKVRARSSTTNPPPGRDLGIYSLLPFHILDTYIITRCNIKFDYPASSTAAGLRYRSQEFRRLHETNREVAQGLREERDEAGNVNGGYRVVFVVDSNRSRYENSKN